MAASEPTPTVNTDAEPSQSLPETSAEEEASEKSDTPQPEADAPQTPEDLPTEDTGPDAANPAPESVLEAAPPEEAAAEEKEAPESEATPDTKEEPKDESSPNPEPASDDKPVTEAESAAEEPSAVAEPCPLSAPPESAGSGDSSLSQTCREGKVEALHVAHLSQFLFCQDTVGKDPGEGRCSLVYYKRILTAKTGQILYGNLVCFCYRAFDGVS